MITRRRIMTALTELDRTILITGTYTIITRTSTLIIITRVWTFFITTRV